MCGKWRFFTHVKKSRSESILQYYDILYHLPNHWTRSSRFFEKDISNVQLQNNPSSLHILTLYTIRTMTTSVYQKRISKDSYYSLYVHMCLRNANTTRDMREEEHKVLNRIITYFGLCTFAASICRFFMTRYDFSIILIIKLYRN